MVGEACLPSNAYYPRTPDYTLYSGIHVCRSEHSDSSFVYGFMSLDNCLGTMTATTSNLLHSACPWVAIYLQFHEFRFLADRVLVLADTFCFVCYVDTFCLVLSWQPPSNHMSLDFWLLVFSSYLTHFAFSLGCDHSPTLRV